LLLSVQQKFSNLCYSTVYLISLYLIFYMLVLFVLINFRNIIMKLIIEFFQFFLLSSALSLNFLDCHFHWRNFFEFWSCICRCLHLFHRDIHLSRDNFFPFFTAGLEATNSTLPYTPQRYLIIPFSDNSVTGTNSTGSFTLMSRVSFNSIILFVVNFVTGSDFKSRERKAVCSSFQLFWLLNSLASAALAVKVKSTCFTGETTSKVTSKFLINSDITNKSSFLGQEWLLLAQLCLSIIQKRFFHQNSILKIHYKSNAGTASFDRLWTLLCSSSSVWIIF
jgi:hypothetical protein